MPSLTRPLGLLMVLFAGAWSTPALALDVGLRTVTSICFGGSVPGRCRYGNDGITVGGAVGGSGSGAGSEINIPYSGGGPGGGYFAAYAGAVQDYGVAHVAANLSVLDTNADGRIGYSSWQVTSSGQMVDRLVITGGTGAAFLQLGWTITGQALASGGNGVTGAAGAQMVIDAFSYSRPEPSQLVTGYGTTGSVYSAGNYLTASDALPFSFGVPLELVIETVATANAGYTADHPGPTFGAEAHANFGHTAVLTSIEAFDRAGRRIDGIRISAASGTAYPLSPVPEPGMWLLSLAGLVVIAQIGGRKCLLLGARQV